MFRPASLAASLAIALAMTAPMPATANQDQLLTNVSRELPNFVPGVDAASLSRHQLAAIYQIIHSGESHSDKRNLIRSAIGGRFSLRGLLTR